METGSHGQKSVVSHFGVMHTIIVADSAVVVTNAFDVTNSVENAIEANRITNKIFIVAD